MRTHDSTKRTSISLALTTATMPGQAVEAVRVVSRPTNKTVELPARFVPYLSVPIHTKISGFVERVEHDLSAVHDGQLLPTMVAPELNAHPAKARAKVSVAESQKLETHRAVAAQGTYERMRVAAATPGVIALVQAEKQLGAERARFAATKASIQATQEAMKAIEALQLYLRVTDRFSGVITTRNVHPGALVRSGKDDLAMFEPETVDGLRLVVPVPEADVGAIAKSAKVGSSVSAYLGEHFTEQLTKSLSVLSRRQERCPSSSMS